MKKQTLQSQFRIWTVLLIVVPTVLIMSIYTVGQISIAKQQNLVLIGQRVHSQERLIDYWIGERADSVREISQTDAFRRLDESQMKSALSLKQDSDPNFDSLSYIHKDGFFRMSTLSGGIQYPLATGKPYFEAALAGKEYISDVVIGRNSGKPIINFSFPIYDYAGNFQGLILGSVKMTTLQILLRENWFGETGEIDLVNQDGMLLNEARYGQNLNDQGFTADNTMKFKMSTDALRNIKLGESGTTTWTDYRGQTVLGAYQHVPERGWTLIGKINEGEVLTPIYKQLMMMAGATIFIILLILPLVTLITNRIKRPIDWLIGQSNLIAVENYEMVGRDKMGEKTNYEFATLCETFITMSHKIQNTIGLLKENEADLGRQMTQIEEINCELEETNAMLEEEISERQKIQEEINKLNDTLEEKVKERTSQLDQSNTLLLSKIEAQTRAEEALKKSEERLKKYQILSEKANDIMIFLDDEGSILEVNDAAVRMYGYTFEEFLVMTIFNLRQIEKTTEIIKQMELSHQVGVVFETIHYRKDGTPIHVEVSSQGKILGSKNVLLSIVRDITERKKAQQEIILAMEKAEAANAAKSQFLANMSHEIRTPMNGIVGMTDITLMTELSEKQREYLTIVKSSTMSLLRVLNDILDYSKIEAGKIDLEKNPFDLYNTVNEVVELFEPGAKQKGLCVILNIDKRIPRTIIGDSVRLRQVLSNLVGNGIKFTAQGKITINVYTEEIYNNKVKLKFVVQDTGIGISEDKLDKLFKRFSQVDDSDTRQFGGTGLGLAISKKLIEIMDGEIDVKSKENVGSMFFFTAVFGLQERGSLEISPNLPVSEQVEYQNLELKKVLLVEDDLVSRNMLTIILKQKGFSVIAVENGKQALTAFEEDQFGIILMDINMPYLDGYATTGLIRLKEKNMNFRTPIIAMTAYALKGDREKCLDAGMDDYISKPINITEVVKKIAQYV